MKPLAPNTLLQNRYLIVHLIGKGGMGDVYLAVDQRLGSAIALKRTLHAEDSMLGDAFEREARTLARLRHPVLPKVSDHFTENDNQYLVMEHISGDDLAKRLEKTQKPFPLSWVLFWADQLLDALAYLHSHEPPIIHRDIKPQNLKLTDDNNIVLLDFGLSKNSVGQTISQARTSAISGSVVGYTPHYAPMEQIRGTGTNPRSDIYSLSATLYQLLTNVVPPDALSRADFLLSGKQDPIVPINEVNSEIPKAISDVVLQGISISQDKRFADAREMQRVLRETYAKLQTDENEKTIAFSLENEEIVVSGAAATVLEDKTDQFPAAANEQTAAKEAMGAKTIPFGMMENGTAESSLPPAKNASDTVQIQNFDATVRMDKAKPEVSSTTPPLESAPVTNVAAPQLGIKTQVFGDDFGTNGYSENNQTPLPADVPNDKTASFIQVDDQPAEIDFAQTQANIAFDSVPEVPHSKTENYAAESNEQAFASPNAPVNYDSQPSRPVQAPPVRTVQKQEKKKSKGFLLAILGTLFALLVLGGAGGFAAWYYLTPTGTSEATNTATPAPTVEETPVPTATPEQANTNTGNISNSEVVASNSADNSTVNAATPTPEPNKAETSSSPTTAPTTATVTPTRPTQQQQQQQTTKTQRQTTTTTTRQNNKKTEQKTRGTIIPQ